MPTKTYVLLPHMDSDAPVYTQLPNGQREKVKKIPFHRPTLRQEFYDENGNNKVIRYKSYSEFIDQRQQIEKEKIEANTPFTPTEYNDLKFRHGILTTNKIRAQQYLEAHPEFIEFKGNCDTVRQPTYKLLDEVKEAKEKNSDIRLRVKAATKILDLSLEEAQSMLIRLNGSFFETPQAKDGKTEADATSECQNMLMEFIDDAEEEGLKAVLMDEEDATIDDKTTVLIGKLINAGKLSFDAVEGKVSKKGKDGEWIEIRNLSTEYSIEERKRMFSNFLNTAEGKPLKNDLESDLANTSYEETKKKAGRPSKIN